MFSFLKKHPFAVEAFFEKSIVLTFAFPKEHLADLIPECLDLDLFDGKWAFVAVAMVQTKEMRPKGFPRFMGRDFFLMGYRIFVRYTTSSGRKLRGLYIMKSDTDSRFMKTMGNIFTDYNYNYVDTMISEEPGKINVKGLHSGFSVSVTKSDGEIDLPEGSPFADWREARRFAGPMPFTFTYREKTRDVLMIEGVRSHWKPAPIKVNAHSIPFLESIGNEGAVLANAFIVEDIPYYWKKGELDPWKSI
jgi:hypothetical protein